MTADVTDEWPDFVRQAVGDEDIVEALDLVSVEERLTEVERELIERIERIAVWCCAGRLMREGKYQS